MNYAEALIHAVVRAREDQVTVDIRRNRPGFHYAVDSRKPLRDGDTHVASVHCDGRVDIVGAEPGAPGVRINISDTVEPEEELEEQEPPKSKPAFVSVAVYMIELRYGGGEEGGWWYECGYPIDELLDGIEPDMCLPKSFLDEEEARAYCLKVNEALEVGPNKGRRPLSSVLSDGRYRARCQDGHPKHFPTERPHYE